MLDNFLQQFFDITIEENFQLQAKFKEPLEGDKFPVTLSIRTPKGDWQNLHSFVKENYAFLSMNEDVLKSFFNFDRKFYLPIQKAKYKTKPVLYQGFSTTIQSNIRNGC